MDQIIFYKEEHHLSSQIEKIRFSYDRPYKLHFAVEYNQLGLLLHPKFEGLLFYFTSTISDMDRMRLLYLNMTYPGLFICLISDAQHALDAWKLNVFHFEAMPVNGQVILESYRKFIHSSFDKNHELILQIAGSTVNIPHNEILYLEAEGNYTNIFLSTGKKILYTKQLGKFEELIEQNRNFKRLHRSLIINLKLIRSIGHDTVIFYGENNYLDISSRFKLVLKKYLMGK